MKKKTLKYLMSQDSFKRYLIHNFSDILKSKVEDSVPNTLEKLFKFCQAFGSFNIFNDIIEEISNHKNQNSLFECYFLLKAKMNYNPDFIYLRCFDIVNQKSLLSPSTILLKEIISFPFNQGLKKIVCKLFSSGRMMDYSEFVLMIMEHEKDPFFRKLLRHINEDFEIKESQEILEIVKMDNRFLEVKEQLSQISNSKLTDLYCIMEKSKNKFLTELLRMIINGTLNKETPFLIVFKEELRNFANKNSNQLQILDDQKLNSVTSIGEENDRSKNFMDTRCKDLIDCCNFLNRLQNHNKKEFLGNLNEKIENFWITNESNLNKQKIQALSLCIQSDFIPIESSFVKNSYLALFKYLEDFYFDDPYDYLSTKVFNYELTSYYDLIKAVHASKECNNYNIKKQLETITKEKLMKGQYKGSKTGLLFVNSLIKIKLSLKKLVEFNRKIKTHNQEKSKKNGIFNEKN
jgi:hypothetical protein